MPCREAKNWVRTRQTVKNVMGRKAEAAKREGQSLDPLLSSCDSIQSLVSSKYGAGLVPGPEEIHSLGTAFKVVLILALASFGLKNVRRLLTSGEVKGSILRRQPRPRWECYSSFVSTGQK